MSNQPMATILSAEDDDDHYMLIESAISEFLNGDKLERVNDGEELLDYLKKRGSFTEQQVYKPDLILLDLNMPRKNGIEALMEIRSDDNFRLIPVVIFSVSNDAEDIRTCYNLGANSFITKPSDFQEYMDTMKRIFQYWIRTSSLPN